MLPTTLRACRAAYAPMLLTLLAGCGVPEPEPGDVPSGAAWFCWRQTSGETGGAFVEVKIWSDGRNQARVWPHQSGSQERIEPADGWRLETETTGEMTWFVRDEIMSRETARAVFKTVFRRGIHQLEGWSVNREAVDVGSYIAAWQIDGETQRVSISGGWSHETLQRKRAQWIRRALPDFSDIRRRAYRMVQTR